MVNQEARRQGKQRQELPNEGDRRVMRYESRMEDDEMEIWLGEGIRELIGFEVVEERTMRRAEGEITVEERKIKERERVEERKREEEERIHRRSRNRSGSDNWLSRRKVR